MGGSSAASNEAKKARQAEEARQARIRAGTGKINQTFDSRFGEPFYSGIESAYSDYARPQLEDQFGDASDELAFSLARRGTLDSSMRGEQTSELEKLYDLQSQDIADQGREMATKTRTQVEDARTGLISMLSATGDDQGAAQAALNRAQALSKPPAFSPLSNLFADFTGGLAMQAGLERSYAMGGPRPRYNTGMFTPGSSVVVR